MTTTTIYQACINQKGIFEGFITGTTKKIRQQKARILQVKLYGKPIKETSKVGRYRL